MRAADCSDFTCPGVQHVRQAILQAQGVLEAIAEGPQVCLPLRLVLVVQANEIC